jgi:hypothetical protein
MIRPCWAAWRQTSICNSGGSFGSRVNFACRETDFMLDFMLCLPSSNFLANKNNEEQRRLVYHNITYLEKIKADEMEGLKEGTEIPS